MKVLLCQGWERYHRKSNYDLSKSKKFRRSTYQYLSEKHLVWVTRRALAHSHSCSFRWLRRGNKTLIVLIRTKDKDWLAYSLHWVNSSTIQLVYFNYVYNVKKTKNKLSHTLFNIQKDMLDMMEKDISIQKTELCHTWVKTCGASNLPLLPWCEWWTCLHGNL